MWNMSGSEEIWHQAEHREGKKKKRKVGPWHAKASCDGTVWMTCGAQDHTCFLVWNEMVFFFPSQKTCSLCEGWEPQVFVFDTLHLITPWWRQNTDGSLLREPDGNREALSTFPPLMSASLACFRRRSGRFCLQGRFVKVPAPTTSCEESSAALYERILPRRGAPDLPVQHWKTILFSLAALAPRCGLDYCSVAAWRSSPHGPRRCVQEIM